MVPERGVLTASGEALEVAAKQAAVIAPLAEQPRVGLGSVDDAAQQLGVSRRQVYV